MKIIVLGPDYGNYQAASYQHEFMNSLKNIASHYYHFNEAGIFDLDFLLLKANFTPDFVFYNHGWLTDNILAKEITYSQVKGRWPKNVKHIIFLNKEYVLLKEKLFTIKKYRFDLIFTHLHNLEKKNKTDIKSIFLPLACNINKLSNLRNRKLSERKYDLYFSGILQNWDQRKSQSDLRKKIQNELFYCLYDFPILKKLKYWNLRIYWKPFYKNRIKNVISNWLHGKKLDQKNYFDTLTNSKCVLHTSSPIGIISTRVFEALGAGAIGLYSDSSNADVIFKNMVHFVSFSEIKDLIEKIYLIKSNSQSSKFQQIANKGREFVENNHTWNDRAQQFLNQLKKI